MELDIGDTIMYFDANLYDYGIDATTYKENRFSLATLIYMKVWSIRQYEMETCCRMQIDSILKLLYECRQSGDGSAISVTPRYGAAPNDESLFEYLSLSAQSVDGGKIELSGCVVYWHPCKGSWEKKATIRTFDSLDSCIVWLESGAEAIEQCAEALI